MRLSESQRDYAGRVETACQEICGSEAARRGLSADDTSLNSDEAFRYFAERDLLGVSLPVEDGGLGRTFTEECLLLEETTRVGVPILAYATALTAAQSYLRFGSADQRRDVVSVIRHGGVESITLTEPDAGSDLASVTTSARRDGDAWVIDGRKTWISFAHLARHLLVLARSDPTGDRHDGLTLLMVPTDTPGVEIRPIQTMGAHIVNDVILTGVRVPHSAVVGLEGEAWRHISRGLAVERLIIAAMSVGAAQRSLDQVLHFV
ncbi:MAG: acyl-CoA dehydrogenase, partial [Frondihabitans sp.]|nr:acyl-CoA dehydrogenase [Frondihabitans sp.]